MKSSTVKTSLGFVGTLLEKYTPLRLRRNDLDAVFNYLPLNDSLATSGQPSEPQFKRIQDAGYTTVINLAPHHAENALKNEQALLDKLGLTYIHIPVDFKKPTEDDFAQFVIAMQNHATGKLWVHCAANMRVSAFIYRYRTEILGEDAGASLVDLHRIWEPFGVWQRFVFRQQAPGGTPE